MRTEVGLTLEVSSSYPNVDRYLGLLDWLGLDQTAYELIEKVPKLVELRESARREWREANQGEDD